MLPTFRVRRVRAIDKDGTVLRGPAGSVQELKVSEADGVITLTKQRYDELLARQPKAALRYLDIDDGDIIEVGSSFELQQRLLEPNHAGQADEMHSFDIDRSDDVVETWRQLDGGNSSEDPRHTSPQLSNANVEDTQLDKGKAKAVPLPENRWASYSTLPDSFDQPPPLPPKLANHSEPEQVQYQPLLDMYESELAKLSSSSPALNPTRVESEQPTRKQGTSEQPSLSTPGEVLTHSLKSLLNGVTLLASSFKLTNTELQQQLALAQQDIPHNIEKAIKASLATIESLRGAFPAMRGARPTIDPLQAAKKVWTKNPKQSSPEEPRTEPGPVEGERVAKHPLSDKFEAERIISRRWIFYGGLDGPLYKQYLIRWAGKGPDADTWYDVENLADCWGLIETYERENPESQRSAHARARGTYIGFSPERLAFGGKCEAIHTRTAGNRMVPHGRKPSSPAPKPATLATEGPPTSFYAPPPVQQLGHRKSEPALRMWERQTSQTRNEAEQPTHESSFMERYPPVSHFDELPIRTSDWGEKRLPQPVEPRVEASGPTLWQSSSLFSRGPRAADETVNSPRREPVEPLFRKTSQGRLRRRDYNAGGSPTQPPSPWTFENSEYSRAAPREESERRPFRRGHGLLRGEATARRFEVKDGPPAAAGTLSAQKSMPILRGASGGPQRSQTTKTGRASRLERVTFRDDSALPASTTKPVENGPSPKHKSSTDRLVEMGFARAEAEAAVAGTDGDLTKAIDVLEEDQAAWADAHKAQGAKDPLPGSWDEELYG